MALQQDQSKCIDGNIQLSSSGKNKNNLKDKKNLNSLPCNMKLTNCNDCGSSSHILPELVPNVDRESERVIHINSLSESESKSAAKPTRESETWNVDLKEYKKTKRKKKFKEKLEMEPVNVRTIPKRVGDTSTPICVSVGDTSTEFNCSDDGDERGNNSEESSTLQTVQDNLQKMELVPPQLNMFQQMILFQNYIVPLKKRSIKNENALFLCKLCQYHCDTLGVVQNHIQDQRHMNAIEEKLDMVTLQLLPHHLPEQLASITNLIEDVVRDHGLPEKDIAAHYAMVAQLNTHLEKCMPGCSLRIYGSYCSGLALKASDLNIELVVPSDCHSPDMFKSLATLIENQQSKFIGASRNFNAEIPSISFMEAQSRTPTVICLSNNHSYNISKLLGHYVQMDDRIRKLGIMFRIWAKDTGLDSAGKGMWPPYAFSLLLVFFLQQLKDPVLPVLHDLVDKPESGKPEHYLDPSELAGQWETTNTMSLGELWLSLLRFYIIDFNVLERVVCIRQHAPLKPSFKKWNGKKISIEDPFLPKINLSRGLTTMAAFNYAMNCFRNTYKYYGILQTAMGPIFHCIHEEFPCESGETLKNISQHVTPDSAIESFMKNDPCYSLEAKHVMKTGRELSLLAVSSSQATRLFQNFNPRYLSYSYFGINFIGNQTFPEFCNICQKDGHLSGSCNEEKLHPFVKDLPPMEQYFLDGINAFCKEIAEKYAPTKAEIAERQQFVTELEDFVTRSFPEAKLELFGSSCNGFGLHKSDMDICLTFKNNKTGKELPFATIIEDLVEKLREFDQIEHLVAITTAKVPILKFHHPNSCLDGDISVYNTLAQQNTRLLRTYAAIDPRVKVLGYVVKRFAKVCDICDASRGSLSSYAYILMLIYFLQRCEPPVLPVLQELEKPEIPQEDLIDDCDTYFYDDLDNLHKIWPELYQNKCTVGELWRQFIEFYTVKFDFPTYVVAIRQKKPLLRFEKLWTSKCMAIEDPFKLSHNLGVGLSKRMHVFIVKSFRKAYEHFGTPSPEFQIFNLYENYFLNGACLTVGDPPNDRGCRVCKKIGHLVKDCPNRKQLRKKRRGGNGNSKYGFGQPEVQKFGFGHLSQEMQNHGQRKWPTDLSPLSSDQHGQCIYTNRNNNGGSITNAGYSGGFRNGYNYVNGFNSQINSNGLPLDNGITRVGLEGKSTPNSFFVKSMYGIPETVPPFKSYANGSWHSGTSLSQSACSTEPSRVNTNFLKAGKLSPAALGNVRPPLKLHDVGIHAHSRPPSFLEPPGFADRGPRMSAPFVKSPFKPPPTTTNTKIRSENAATSSGLRTSWMREESPNQAEFFQLMSRKLYNGSATYNRGGVQDANSLSLANNMQATTPQMINVTTIEKKFL